MKAFSKFLHGQAPRLTALVLCGVAYWSTRLPDIPQAERGELAARFRFTELVLGNVAGDARSRNGSRRAVNPSLSRITSWISSVGASIAITDVDGDGIFNDLCLVDPRTDQISVVPVPSAQGRYATFSLDWPSAVDGNVAPMGCLPGDLNEDGWIDLLVYFWGRPPGVFLRVPNTALSTGFVWSDLLGKEAGTWYTNSVTSADLDGDGHLDLVIGNYFQDGAEILNARSRQRESMQRSMSRAFNGGRNRILIWEGAVQGDEPAVMFRDASQVLDERVARAWTLAVGATDLDGDLLPELYFANDFGPDRLLHNRTTDGQLKFAVLEGNRGFLTASSKVLGRDSFKGMGVDFADVNDDGRLDIFVSNIAAEYSLEESHFAFVSTGDFAHMKGGTAPYTDQSEAMGLSRSGWAWDVRVADFDNNGVMEVVQATGFVKGEVNRWPELHEVAMGNDELLSDPRVWPQFGSGDDLSGHQRNPFFVRGSDNRYYDLSVEVGIDKPYVSRGIALGDVDMDGDLDLAIANQWESSVLLRNESPDVGSSLVLRLLVPLHPNHSDEASVCLPMVDGCSGRPAIGATAALETALVRRTAFVDGGNGHSGTRSPEIHFGLGEHPPGRPVAVTLRWRDPMGAVHEDELSLLPGRHTVMLGWPSGVGKEGVDATC